jgi:hypothetical protein
MHHQPPQLSARQDFIAGKFMRKSFARSHEGDDWCYTNTVGGGHIAKKAKVVKDLKKERAKRKEAPNAEGR